MADMPTIISAASAAVSAVGALAAVWVSRNTAVRELDRLAQDEVAKLDTVLARKHEAINVAKDLAGKALASLEKYVDRVDSNFGRNEVDTNKFSFEVSTIRTQILALQRFAEEDVRLYAAFQRLSDSCLFPERSIHYKEGDYRRLAWGQRRHISEALDALEALR